MKVPNLGPPSPGPFRILSSLTSQSCAILPFASSRTIHYPYLLKALREYELSKHQRAAMKLKTDPSPSEVVLPIGKRSLREFACFSDFDS
jgi:hypothetical protein